MPPKHKSYWFKPIFHFISRFANNRDGLVCTVFCSRNFFLNLLFLKILKCNKSETCRLNSCLWKKKWISAEVLETVQKDRQNYMVDVQALITWCHLKSLKSMLSIAIWASCVSTKNVFAKIGLFKSSAILKILQNYFALWIYLIKAGMT